MNEALKTKEKYPEQKVFDGEVEPSMPNLFINSFTLMGVDSNNNGIRDDVDIWINRTGLDYNERMAMRQYAKTLTLYIESCAKNNKHEVVKYNKKEFGDSVCLDMVSDHKRKKRQFISTKLKTLIQNQEIRTCNSFYSNNSIVTSTGVIMESKEYCEFVIHDLKKENKLYNDFYNNK